MSEWFAQTARMTYTVTSQKVGKQKQVEKTMTPSEETQQKLAALKAKRKSEDQNIEKHNKKVKDRNGTDAIEHMASVMFINEYNGAVSSVDPSKLYEESIKKLAVTNDDNPSLFIKGDWVELLQGELKPISSDRFMVVLADRIKWMKYDSNGMAVRLAEVPKHARVGVYNQHLRFDLLPQIDGVINHPILRNDGSIVTKKGYDRETKLYIKEDQQVELMDSVEEAVKALRSPFRFFLADRESVVNMWAYFFTLLYSYKIGGNIPYFAFNAPQQGVGKGLLLGSMYSLVNGGDPSAMTWPTQNKDDILERKVGGKLLAGNKFTYFDNVPDGFEIRSEFLALYSTEPQMAIKILYENIPRDMRTNMIIGFTGNHISFDQHLLRRVQAINLESDVEHPEDRDLPDLKSDIQKNRPLYLGAAMTILKDWQQNGSLSKNRKASFESWSQTIGGVLEHVGIGSLETKAIVSDTGILAAMKEFLRLVYDRFETDTWTTSKVAEIALGTDRTESDDRFLDIDYEPILIEFLGKNTKASLGKKISSFVGRQFTLRDNLQVKLLKVVGKNPTQFQMERLIQ